MVMRDGSGDIFIRFGTSSFSSRDWVGPFYPEGTAPGDYIKYYSSVFDTVEVDSTYYRIPSRQMIKNWTEKTPDNFLFSAKFPKSVVHGGKNAKPDPDVILIPDLVYRERDRFLNVMSKLGRRLGPLILQFPYFSKAVFGSRKPFMDRLDKFLMDLPREFRYGVEIRNRGWLHYEFGDLLRDHNVSLVLVDQAWMPHADELARKIDPITADFCYIRLLGDRKEVEAITRKWDREVINRESRLRRWADFLAGLNSRGLKTLIYVNNHYAGHAPATLRRLRDMFFARIDERPENQADAGSKSG